MTNLSHSLSSTLFLDDKDETPCLAEPLQIVGKVIDKDFQRTKPFQSHQPTTTTKVSQTTTPQYRWQFAWPNVFGLSILHIGACIGLYQALVFATWKTAFWGYFVSMLSTMGISAGAHRLWSHRAYKAKLPLRILLAFLQTLALQTPIYEWVRDHRVHHKFTDTDADPHNAKRGFFFSHIGWLLVKKQKEVIAKSKPIDISDVTADPVIRFQRKYYPILILIVGVALPVWVPWYFWNEVLSVAFYASVLRYVLSLHGTFLINSAAHTYGARPYDKSITPTDNGIVSIFTYGEGWHNYHHAFPWDYKAAELLNYHYSMSTAFIEFMAKIGWAYDLKSASDEMIQKRTARTGDKSFLNHDRNNGNKQEEWVWGWGDRDMKSDDVDLVKIQHRLRG